jgi:hypothetical protein
VGVETELGLLSPFVTSLERFQVGDLVFLGIMHVRIPTQRGLRRDSLT